MPPHRAALSDALAAGDIETCLRLVAENPQVPPALLLGAVEAALKARRPDIAARLVEHGSAPRQPPQGGAPPWAGRPPPPGVMRLGVVAACDSGQLALAARLIAAARRTHPDRAALWDSLAARHAEARHTASDAGRLAASVSAAMEQEDWPQACAQLRAYRDHPERRWDRYAQLALKVHDPVGVLEAEAALLAEAGVAAIEALPPTAAMPLLQARQHIGRVAEVMRLTQRLRELHPRLPMLAQKQWQLLTRQRDHAAALEVAREAHGAGASWALQAVVGSLLAQGELDACEAFLQEAARSGQLQEGRARAKAWAALWMARDTPRRAAACVLAEVGSFPEGEAAQHLALFAEAARDTALLDAQLARVAAWSASPEEQPRFLRFAPAILRHHFGAMLHWAKVAPHAEALARRVLAPSQAVTLASLFSLQGDLDAARDIVERSLGWFPAALPLHRAALTGYRRANDVEAARAACIRLRAHLPPDVAMDILLGAPPAAWDLAELPAMLEHALDTEDSEGQGAFFSSLRRVRLSPDLVASLLDSPAVVARPALLARVDFILTRALDLRQLDDAVHEPIPFKAFVASRAAAHARLDAAMDRLIRVETGPGSGISAAEQGFVAAAAGELRRIEARAPAAFLLTADNYADAVGLTRILLERLRDKAPTSVLRLGDGEGHFLPPIPAVAADAQADRALIQRTWWGDRALDPAGAEALEAALVAALSRADVLGVPPAWRLVRDLGLKPELQPQHRGILNGLAHVAAMPRLPVVTSAQLHHDLQAWNLWREILGAVRAASWISCHDLAPYLHEMHGVDTRQGILIPPEHRWAGQFGRQARETLAHETLLDRHDAICAALAPEPGELWLVAAGSLGKIHCDILRARGGFAIDIGSLADSWMGFATRDFAAEQGAEPALSNTLLTAHPLAGFEDRSRLLGRPGLIRSSRDGRLNRARPQDAAATAPEAPRLLRIIGHPRCASGYMATLFVTHGLEIGHETLRRDGLASWMQVVPDLCVPYGDNTSRARFARTVVHVRDPAEALPSIMLENGMTPSFDFRRQHILRATGVDISAYGSALERATASLVHWLDMALAQRPDAVFRAEAAEAEVAAWLQRDPVMQGAVQAARGAGAGSAGGDARYNSSARRFDRAKPVPTAADFVAMDGALRDRLAAHCERFGYPLPWAGR